MERLNARTIQYPFSSGDLITKIAYDASNRAQYIGLADPGTSASDAQWQIKKITYDGNGNVTDIQFAQGVNTYSKVWDNRATYSYS